MVKRYRFVIDIASLWQPRRGGPRSGTPPSSRYAPGRMSPEHLRLVALCTAALALVLGALYLLRSRLRARRRRQREAIWRELCLRLELVPQPRNPEVAAGQLQGTGFSLRDTGSEWLLELPLAQPLLPPRVVLLSPKARSLRPSFRVRPLRWGSGLKPPVAPVWSRDRALAPGKVRASQPFLEEAERAAQAHPPLRVEPRWLVHALRSGAALSVSEVRDAVRALEATAQRWLAVVTEHGLPEVKDLPRPLSVLREVLAQWPFGKWLLLTYAGLLLTVGALFQIGRGLFFALLVGSLLIGQAIVRKKRYGFRGALLGALALACIFGAPWIWARSLESRSTTPTVISVRDAAQLSHRSADFLRFHDAVVRKDLAAPGARGFFPVVSRSWGPNELVTVIAVRPPPEEQAEGPLAGVAVKANGGTVSAAIEVALKHQFSLHSHVRFVDFSSRPETLTAWRKSQAIFLGAFPALAWIGWVLWLWRRELRGRERALEGLEASGERRHEAA
ncbi:MAG: hypothetical protein ACJ8AT_14670 [Hyalangium sp.]|uniref:hypothetical protein n=1 Tax=Hyalangium sp. TaxID=2028555 RepID=UPI003899AB92